MALAEVLKIVAGVSSVCGLAAMMAVLYVWSQARKAEQSVREMVEGDALFTAECVVEILSKFDDDKLRLEALEKLCGHATKRADSLLRKVKGTIDLNKLNRSAVADRLKLRVILAVLFFSLAALASLARVMDAKMDAPQTSHTDSGLGARSEHSAVAGLAFNPFMPGQDPDLGAEVTTDQLISRLTLLAPYTQRVRTYAMGHGQDKISEIARMQGVRTVLGAFVSDDNETTLREIAALARAAAAG